MFIAEKKVKEEEILLRPARRNRKKEQTPTDSDSDRFSRDQKKLICKSNKSPEAWEFWPERFSMIGTISCGLKKRQHTKEV